MFTPDRYMAKVLNILKRLFLREDAATGIDATSPRYGGLGWNTIAPGLTADGAMRIATVFRCVRLLSESVANLPLHYLTLHDGIYEEDTQSKLSYLLSVQPDNAYNAYDFWSHAVQQMLLYGNAYIVPVYNPVTMDYERFVLCGRGTVNHDTLSDTYTVCDTVNNLNGTFDEDEIIHLKNITIDGKNGLSTIAYARMATDIASTGDNETLDRFANGGNVRGIICNNSSVRGFGEYQDKELDKAAKDMASKFRNRDNIVATPGQVDFKQLSLTSTDMQFLESRKFTVREICRFFGVHPSYVFDDTATNYKSAEMANVAFLSSTLNPILRKIECELQRKLSSPTMWHIHRFEFDRRGLYACDLASKADYQTKTIAAGLYTVNEWRKAENKRPVDGGDTVLVSANLRSISETNNQAE